jgi:hypothetical protein
MEINRRKPGLSCQGQIGNFLDQYLVAESLLRQVITYYAKDTGAKVSEKLRTEQIIAALIHFDISVAKNDIIDTFQGGTGKRGIKSARQLRNGYLHDLDPEDRNEIESKATLISTLISRVLSPILH